LTVLEVIKRRGIKEILHFTTNRGVLGTLHTGALKSRNRISKEEQLEFVLKLNSTIRKDTQWLDHVNLSITRINGYFFEISSERWHITADIWWAVLAFDPEILTHKGVYFTTTNNIYPSCSRGPGGGGIEAMFAPKVIARYGAVMTREKLADSVPTCEQAEVLYPGEIPLKYLKRIYVRKDSEADEVNGQLALTNQEEIEVVVNKKIFK